MKTKNEFLPYHKCKLEDAGNDEILYKIMKSYYCIDYQNQTFIGKGLYDGDLVQYIKIKLFHCLYGNKMFPNRNITCNTNMTHINSLPNYYISYLLPKIWLNSTSLDKPFKTNVFKFYEKVDYLFTKKMYFYFKNVLFNDDQNYISTDETSESLITTDRSSKDIVMYSGVDLENRPFHETSLYFDKINNFYYRRFQKLQDVVAQVGGTLKLFSVVLSFFTMLYNNFKLKIDLISHILKTNDDIQKPPHNMSQDLLKSNVRSNNYIYDEKYDNNHDITKKDDLKKNNYGSYGPIHRTSNMNVIASSINDIFSNSRVTSNNNNQKENEQAKEVRARNFKIIQMMEKQEINLIRKFHFIEYVFTSLLCRTKNKKQIVYMKIKKIVEEKMDASYIIRNGLLFEKLLSEHESKSN